MASSVKPREPFRGRARRLGIAVAVLVATSILSGAAWFQIRYDDAPEQKVTLWHFNDAEYPEDPEARSRVFGNYQHQRLIIERIEGTRFRFVIEPVSDRATTIELPEVDLAHIVAAVPPWVKADPDLTKIG